MAQTRVNGAGAADQFLTGELSHFILDSGNASTNVASFGFTTGNPNAGEEALKTLATVANPVIVNPDSSNARLLYFAVEVDGVTATALQTAVRLGSVSDFASATVTEGSYKVA